MQLFHLIYNQGFKYVELHLHTTVSVFEMWQCSKIESLNTVVLYVPAVPDECEVSGMICS